LVAIEATSQYSTVNSFYLRAIVLGPDSKKPKVEKNNYQKIYPNFEGSNEIFLISLENKQNVNQ